ncbi:hypothetical protein HWV62_21392 [Athelia sp. TMB]|nr:hypothetical protein HWV62_26056 [Athelia sp. TMB]KAF7971360.1 hypothetical protein HWV62_21392 [Athelia sp. TMB]
MDLAYKLAWPEADPALLSSYASPNKLKRAISRIAIERLRAQLDSINHLKANTKELIKILTEIRRGLKRGQRISEKVLLGHQSVVAPIRAVPDDILIEIFSIFMNNGDLPRDKPSPTTLSSVCRRWRTLAHSTSHFWTQITAHFTSSNHLSAGNMIHHYTSLSAARPLRLSLKSKEKTSTYPAVENAVPVEGHDLHQALVASAPRWQSITFTPHTLQFVFEAWLTADASQWSLNMLETIELEDYVEGSPWPGHGDYRLGMFGSAPRLRHIVYGGIENEDFPLTPLELPWDQIEQLDNLTISTVDLVDCLGEIPQLSRCRSIVLSDSLELPENAVSHKAMRSISARIPHRAVLDEFFTFFQFPSLVELRLEGPGNPADAALSQHHFTTFVAHSSCKLQRLVLAGALVKKGDLSLILASVPTVCEFQFSELPQTSTEEDAVFDDHIIERLTIAPESSPAGESQSPLLPRLRTLSLIGGLQFDTKAFTAMILSRASHPQNEGLSPALQNLYVQMSGQQIVPSLAATTVRNPEYFVTVDDFVEVKNILSERAFITATLSPLPDLAFPNLL